MGVGCYSRYTVALAAEFTNLLLQKPVEVKK